MSKLEQSFQFEAGAVRLDNGKKFRPLADATVCWVLQMRAPYEIGRKNFDILYLTSEGKFVHINYCHCESDRRSDRKIWRSDSLPTGRIVKDRWAFEFLLRNQFEILENLKDRCEHVTEPPPQPEQRPLDYWCQFDLVGRDSDLSVSKIDLLQHAREVEKLAIRVVHLLRSWANGQQPSEPLIVLRLLGAHLFNRYRADLENWTGSVDEVPPEFVNLFQLSWSEEYQHIKAVLEQLRSTIEAPLRAYVATRLSVGHEGYPTADEQRMAKEALIAALPGVESGAVALNKAISVFAPVDNNSANINESSAAEADGDNRQRATDSTPISKSSVEVSARDVKRGNNKVAQKRSWTQPDLDEAIREYKAKRASGYSDLVDGVKRGRPGAKKAARNLFGRNAIVRALGVKSPAMVTYSPVWQEIADELGLRGQSKKRGQASGQRIGMDIALEEQTVAFGESVVDQVVRRETIALVEQSMLAAEAKATIEKLQRGEITDDEARELVEVSADQKQDDRTRKIRQGL